MPPPTIIDEKSQLKGILRGSGDMEILGILEGNVDCSARVCIGSRGIVYGDVSGAEVEILGRVEGDVSAETSVTIRLGGEVTGDISADAVHVEKEPAQESA